MKKKSIIAALLLMSLPAFAYEPVRAKDNLSSDLSRCSAYCAAIGGLMQKDYPDHADQHLEMSMLAIRLAGGLSSPEVAVARSKIDASLMMTELDADPTRISILMAKYGLPCKDYMENTEARLLYWMEKTDGDTS